MVGNNSASVVADAYLKGLKGYDIETLWEAVKHGANAVHPQVSSTGRLGYEYYNQLGYVPVSYTHLDVYKRQVVGHRRTSRVKKVRCVHRPIRW